MSGQAQGTVDIGPLAPRVEELKDFRRLCPFSVIPAFLEG
jgi:hypothetical protein